MSCVLVLAVSFPIIVTLDYLLSCLAGLGALLNVGQTSFTLLNPSSWFPLLYR